MVDLILEMSLGIPYEILKLIQGSAQLASTYLAVMSWQDCSPTNSANPRYAPKRGGFGTGYYPSVRRLQQVGPLGRRPQEVPISLSL